MKDIQIFKNKEFGEIRTVELKEEVYFIGKDVAKSLGYERPTKAILDHVDLEDIDEVPVQDSIGRMQNTPIINESGIYSLILSSKLPNAKKFKRWVTKEILPSIRKHGAYLTDSKIEEVLTDPDTIIKLATQLKEERIQKQLLEDKVKEDKPKVLFADAVETSKSSILIGELAKLIKQNGVDVGQNRLFEWLRTNGFLIRRKGSDYNTPTQYSMELGLFETKVRTINNPDGSIRITKTSKVTGKGQIYFINKFKTETV